MTLVLGVLVNQVASLKAAIELYRLTFLVYGQRTTLSTTHRIAFASAMIFCISPATIFFCAMYDLGSWEVRRGRETHRQDVDIRKRYTLVLLFGDCVYWVNCM